MAQAQDLAKWFDLARWLDLAQWLDLARCTNLSNAWPGPPWRGLIPARQTRWPARV